MTHGSLFAGIGGFMLAAQWAGIENVWHSEIESYPCKLLEQHFPQSKNYGDIKKIDWSTVEPIDILTGGFPCQPFSVAGKRGGQSDERYLWPQMFEGIQQIRPRWVIGENVPGIKNLALDTVLSDLEGAGYTCQVFDIPACALNAPHVRHRLWIVAHTISRGREKQHATTFTSRVGFSRWLYAKTGYDWATEPPVCGVDDGVSDRVRRIKGLGNAVVPQIPYILFTFIQQIEAQL